MFHRSLTLLETRIDSYKIEIQDWNILQLFSVLLNQVSLYQPIPFKYADGIFFYKMIRDASLCGGYLGGSQGIYLVPLRRKSDWC